jgi:eukaryotic-like serine/threonine-protein kinase
MKQTIGNYEIVSELGRGGMGVVYKAFEPALNRAVALKMLNEGIAHQPGLVERFYREARAMATLSDPNVVQIYAVGEHLGQPYFVMEYIDGESLGGRLKRERLSVREARKLMAQAASGLQAAHEHGLIHRDIKPGNLMLTQKGTVKVTDFGIALSEGSGERLTGTGGIVGTPGYLSPEACLGETLDARTDIFALGVVFFEMLTGRLPFDDKSPYALMAAVVQAQIPDVTTLNSEVDPNTIAILGKMLARRPAERFQTCAELEAALSANMSASPLPPPRPPANPTAPPAPTPMPPSAPPPITGAYPPAAVPMPTPAPPSYLPNSVPHYPQPGQTPAPQYYAQPQTVPSQVLMPAPKSSAMPWVLGGVGALVVVGLLALGQATPDQPTPSDHNSSTTDPATDTPTTDPVTPEATDSGSATPSETTSADATSTETPANNPSSSASDYSDLGMPNLALSQLSASDMSELQGYNIADNVRRPLRGFVENFREDIDTDGDTWRVYSVVLHEPGDADNDGKFRIDLKHTDKYIAGDGSWTSYSGTQQFDIAIKNFSSKKD